MRGNKRQHNNVLIRSGEAPAIGWSRNMLYSGFNILHRSVVRRQTGFAARITRTLSASERYLANRKSSINGNSMSNQGKPPKTSNAIRSKLASISKTAEVVRHSGPINAKNQLDRQIIVASFFDHQLGRKFQRELTRCGHFSKSLISERKLVITVDSQDSQSASALSEKFRAQHLTAETRSTRHALIFCSLAP